MLDDQNPVNGALAELAVLGTDQDRERLAALRDRLAAGRLRVVVVGEAQRGKSTLINALLGRSVLPTGVTPLTTVVTTVRHGADPHAGVRFLDGHHEQRKVADVPDLVTERGNPGNRRRIGSVTVYTDAPVLAAGAELVDTPGSGSVLEWECPQTARQALETADAAVVVLAADPPVSAREVDLLSAVMGVAVATFVVLNKADHLDPLGLAEAGEFTCRMLSAAASRAAARAGRAGSYCAAGSGWHPGRLYPMAAGAALRDGDPGFTAFAADFTAYLASQRTADLTRSAISQAQRFTTALLDEAGTARRRAREHAARRSDRVERFTTRLGESPVSVQDAVVIVKGECARILFALNDTAVANAPMLRRSIASRLEGAFDLELNAASAAEIDRLGGQRLAGFTLEVVTGWRRLQQASIEHGLATLESRLRVELATRLATLRASAAGLLDLDLAVLGPGEQLAVDWRLGDSIAVIGDPPTPVVRPSPRALPGEPGRRRARQRLRDQLPDLADSYLEKAKATLQQELTERSRTLAQAVEERYGEAGEGIAAALRTAVELGERAAAEAGRTEREMAGREQALRRVLASLAQAVG